MTLGLLTLRDIAIQLYNLTASITKFTVEMQESIALLMGQFARIYNILQGLEASITRRVCPPIVQFTDALGETMALPYQMCVQWKTFRLMLDVVFDGRPGKSRVDMGKFLIMHAAGGRLLLEKSWNHAVMEGDHLQMSMVLDDLLAIEDICPFPSCKAPLLNAEVDNGGRTCPQCSRWALITKTERASAIPRKKNPREDYSYKEDSYEEDLDEEYLDEERSGREYSQKPLEEHIVEDIELYRYIHAMTARVATDNAKEIWGLVIGVYPDIILAFEQFKTGCEYFSNWRQFRRSYNVFITDIERQQLFFEGIMQDLLCGGLDPYLSGRDSKQTFLRIVSDRSYPGWSDPKLTEKLRARLNSCYHWYMDNIWRIYDILKELEDILDIQEVGISY